MSERNNELTQLAELHRSGAISDEEFAELKRQIIEGKSARSASKRTTVVVVVVALALVGAGAVVALSQFGGSNDAEAEVVAGTAPSTTKPIASTTTAEPENPNGAEIERLNTAADQLDDGLRRLPVVVVDSGIEPAAAALVEAFGRESTCDGLEPFLLRWAAAGATVNAFASAYDDLAVGIETSASKNRSSTDGALKAAALRAYGAQREWQDTRSFAGRDSSYVAVRLGLREQRTGEKCG